MSQKTQLLEMFRQNNNMLTLGMIMKTNLGREHSARMSELRKMGHEITCTINAKQPSDNVYMLIEKQPESSEGDFKPVYPSKLQKKVSHHNPKVIEAWKAVKMPCKECGSFYTINGKCNICP